MATRRVIVQELVSVDGFMAGPSGELDFFEAVSDYSEVDQDNLSILDQVDTMVGHGRTLLAEDTGRQDLTLLEAKPYASGIVSLSYAVTRS
jgi:hypothetical protein